MFKTMQLVVYLSFDTGNARPKFVVMVKRTHNRIKFTLALLIFVAGNSFAGGFQINMLSTKATSMGGAFTGFGSDASASFFNPGAMTFREYSQLSLGASFIFSSTSYLSPYAGNTDMEDGVQVPLHVYGIGLLNEKTAIGISVNTPYSLHTTWDDNWTGRYVARETQLKAVYVQPSISYELSETFGIGGGPVIAFGKSYFSKAIPLSSAQGEAGMELDGKSIGFGFNIGLFYKPTDEFSIGLDYRSAVKMNVNDGDASFSNVPSSLAGSYPESATFETAYTLPSVISAGAAYKLTRELTLCMDVNYTTWKSFDTLEFKFENNSQLDYGTGQFYKNVFAVRIGAQYEISEMINVRAGVAFDGSPVNEDYVSPANPDNDRFMFSLGGSINFNEHASIDLAYMLQNIKELEVVNEQYNFGGNYKSLINIFGVTLNYQF